MILVENLRIKAFIVSFVVLAGVLSAAELKLNRYFTDNMVLQRNQPVVVRGSAEKGSKVTVTFAEQTKTGQADDNGNWSVTLDPMAASAESRDSSS